MTNFPRAAPTPGSTVEWLTHVYIFFKWKEALSQSQRGFIMMADGRVVQIEKSFDAILKMKKKKEGQCEEKIIQVCVEEFDLNQE